MQHLSRLVTPGSSASASSGARLLRGRAGRLPAALSLGGNKLPSSRHVPPALRIRDSGVGPSSLASGRCFASLADDEGRESMDYDLLIVGGGPAGLAAAIRAKQVAGDRELNVCVVEKGGEIGSHILSGNIFEPRALNELFPDWKERGAPLETEVTNEALYWFPNDRRKLKFPNILLPKEQHNHGNYVISLGMLSRWLAEQAEELGVEVFPGFAADELVYDENDVVRGIQLKDVGIAKTGEKKDAFEPGMRLLGKQTILAEGCRGSLSMQAQEKYNLTDGKCPQHYGFGLKEVWEVDNEAFS